MKYKITLRNNFGTVVTMKITTQFFDIALGVAKDWIKEHTRTYADMYVSMYVKWDIEEIKKETCEE